MQVERASRWAVRSRDLFLSVSGRRERRNLSDFTYYRRHLVLCVSLHGNGRLDDSRRGGSNAALPFKHTSRDSAYRRWIGSVVHYRWDDRMCPGHRDFARRDAQERRLSPEHETSYLRMHNSLVMRNTGTILAS